MVVTLFHWEATTATTATTFLKKLIQSECVMPINYIIDKLRKTARSQFLEKFAHIGGNRLQAVHTC